MDVGDLRYLAVSVSAGNFGRAAKSLGLSASTVSRVVREPVNVGDVGTHELLRDGWLLAAEQSRHSAVRREAIGWNSNIIARLPQARFFSGTPLPPTILSFQPLPKGQMRGYVGVI